MRRIGLAVVLALSLTLAPLAAEGQQAQRIVTVGVLFPVDRTSALPFQEAFRRGLADHGYVEGQNIAVVRRWQMAELICSCRSPKIC
jgi:hypothetical protein